MPFKIDNDELSPWEQEERDRSRSERIQAILEETDEILAEEKAARQERETDRRAALIAAGGEWNTKVMGTVFGESGKVDEIYKEAVRVEEQQLSMATLRVIRKAGRMRVQEGSEAWTSPSLKRKFTIRWYKANGYLWIESVLKGTVVSSDCIEL
ncbi:MAG TPA: hypothetical protein VI873_03805 [Candidatus Peribacteraceae bacterium]|nr:hypothetical protein [Candidatus Peribacteraceae bacterium]